MTTNSSHEIVPDAGDTVACPVPCTTCDETGPGGCEELAEQRSLLDLGARVGLVSRRHRRAQRLSQRALAGQLGWTQASVNRAEHDAAPLTVRRLEHFLDHLGYRLAIVPAHLHVAAALRSRHVELPHRPPPVRAGGQARGRVDLAPTRTTYFVGSGP